MKQLSISAGLGETAVRDMLQKVTSPRVDTITAIAEQLGVTLTELLEGRVDGPKKIPIVGYVSAGEGWHTFEGDGQIDEIEVSVGAGTPVGLVVRGDSMLPVYRDGDLLLGGRQTATSLHRLIGRDCIVQTTEGGRYVKFVAKGTIRGRVDLKSYNPAHADIENVELAWAAPITMVIRAQR